MTYTGPVVYNEDNKFKKVHFEDIAKGKQDYTTQAKTGWVGMLQHIIFVSVGGTGNARAVPSTPV